MSDRTPAAPQKSEWSRSIRVVLLLAAVAYLALNLFTLDRYPMTNSDEASYAVPGYTFWREGTFGAPMRGLFLGLEENQVRRGRIYVASVGLVLNVLGVGYYQARLVSLAAAVTTLLLTYALGRRLYGRFTALLAVSLLAISSKVFFSSHVARPEMILTAFVVLCMWYWVRSEGGAVWKRMAITGLLATLGVDVHMNGVALIAAMAAVILVDLRPSAKEWLAFAAGVACGFAYWLLLHSLPDPAQALEQARMLDVGFASGEPLLDRFRLEAHTWLRYFFRYPWHISVMELAYLVIGISLMLVLSKGRRRFLPTIAALVGVMVVALSNKQRLDYYLVYWFPLLYLAAAEGLVAAARAVRRRFGGRGGHSLAIPMCVPVAFALLATIGLRLWTYRESDLDAYASQLREFVPQDGTVLAVFQDWFFFYDRGFFAFPFAVKPSLERGSSPQADAYVGPTFADTIEGYGITHLVVDGKFRSFMWKDPAFGREVEEFISEDCRFVAAIRDRFYGDRGAPGEEPFLTEIYVVER